MYAVRFVHFTKEDRVNGIRPYQKVPCSLQVLPIHLGGEDWVLVEAFLKPAPHLKWHMMRFVGEPNSLSSRGESNGIYLDFSPPVEAIRHQLLPHAFLGQVEADRQVLFSTTGGFSTIPILRISWNYQRNMAVVSIDSLSKPIFELWLEPVDDKYTSE